MKGVRGQRIAGTPGADPRATDELGKLSLDPNGMSRPPYGHLRRELY